MTAPHFSPVEMLDKLVGFATAVGGPNGALMAFVQDYLRGHGISCRLLPGPEGDRANLFAAMRSATPRCRATSCRAMPTWCRRMSRAGARIRSACGARAGG